MLQIFYEEYARHGITTMMKSTSKAITAAKAYEAGKLSKAKYDTAVREFQIAYAENGQAGERARQQQLANNLNAVGQGMQAFGNGYNAGRVRMNCMTTGVGNMRMTNCY